MTKLRGKQESMPVFFFIYGGAFIEGTSSYHLYRPDHFIDQNAILVTANYRLGLFGFLSTEDLASPGNYALKDQHLVLLWIKSNIRYFGGNPQKVVIMGQSAGGNNVIHHVISHRSRGLFKDVALTLGIPFENTTKFVETLRGLSTERLQKANFKVNFVHLPSILLDGLPFTPTIEVAHSDAFVTDLTYNSLKKGDIAKVPVMMGITSLEMLFFAGVLEPTRAFLLLYDWSPALLLRRLNIPYSWQTRLIAKTIKKAYFRDNYLSSAPKEELAQQRFSVFFR
nr:unnamed protein product [Callosobruchus analis]